MNKYQQTLLLQNQGMEADGKRSNLMETLLFAFFAARRSLSVFHCCGTGEHASVHFGQHCMCGSKG